MSSPRYLYVLLVYPSIEGFINKNKKSNLIQINFVQIPPEDSEKEFSPQVPDDNWVTTAVKDIAYFLRNSKFNDWDRRFYKHESKNHSNGFYKTFPHRPLKLLHWEVLENCYKNFYKCVIYLHSIINSVPFRRTDDIITKLNANLIPWNISTIRKQNTECKDALLNSDETGSPFEGPREKFLWRISASYFMCWYTIHRIPALSMLEERCDNFANCLDPIHGARNQDPRADDRQSFTCAMYSFCPDPCCPMKYIENLTQCHQYIGNPCFYGDTNNSNVICKLDHKSNQNFEDMINNKWNTSCYCKDSGFEWKSKFGMCVDVNECFNGNNNCDTQTEVCLNLPGTFQCICKLKFYFNNKTKSCIQI